MFLQYLEVIITKIFVLHFDFEDVLLPFPGKGGQKGSVIFSKQKKQQRSCRSV